MCGITGIVGKNANHHLLAQMVKSISHRGPDGQGTWSNGIFSLGHLRLSIIDLSERASQPMVCHVTGNRLSFNGEIYNYREIKAELTGHYPFRSDSDSEVILAAYNRWGTDAISKFRGMFAFAIYDQEKGKLLIARDRFGIKPLYYRQYNDTFIFSSEIKGLIGLKGLYHTPNLKKIYGFIAYRHLDTDSDTFFNEVKQLPPASYSWIDEDGKMISPSSYWQPSLPGSKHFGESDKESFKEALTESVRFHLRSDVPVASFVSGGLDSSTIVFEAADLLGSSYKLQTFSSILEVKTEENALIEVAHKHLQGAVHHTLQLDGSNFLEELPLITYHHDEPLADASMYAHWELCKLARKNGIKVLLSGNGGDEVLGGYASHIYALLGRILKSRDWKDLTDHIQQFSQNRAESALHLFTRSVYELIPYSLREYLKHRSSHVAADLITGDFSPKDYNYYHYRNNDPYTANLFNNLCSWTVPPFLHYEDRNSMAFGIEIRVPMLDHVFFEFVTTYRPEDLLNGRSKQALRDSMRGVVPDEILDQKGKYGFAAPLEQFVMYDLAATTKFYFEQVRKVPFLNQKLAEQFAREVLEKQNPKYFNYFWRTLSVSVWYNTFFHV